jgi:DNA-binding CsgD family transcriptional regulator
MWFEKGVTQGLLNGRTVKLSKREGELVSLLSQGLKNKEIATALSISEATVKVYLSKLFAKVGAKDRFELALFGLRNLAQTGPSSEPPRSLFLPRPDFVARPERADMAAQPRLM